MFLTLLISWRGTLAQYAGRLHRLHAAKRAVVIYDYVDADEPMLAKMALKREAGYRSLGYETAVSGEWNLPPVASSGSCDISVRRRHLAGPAPSNRQR